MDHHGIEMRRATPSAPSPSLSVTPHARGLEFQIAGMVAPMRRLAFLALSWVAIPMCVEATSLPDLHGSWVGIVKDVEVVWQLDEGGRLRLDGRPADYQISGDSLIVRFDPPPQADTTAPRETAIYRFLVSLPERGPARLFVYGFDLGKHGVYLVREGAPEPPLPEDAAPPAPDAATPESRNVAAPTSKRPR